MTINKNYLQLEFGSGNFFQWSGSEKQGFEKHVSTKGKESYRKYFKDGITGVLESVNVRETDFGEQLSMTVKDGEEIYYLPVNIFDQQKHVDNNYAESLIKLLPQLNKGSQVTVRGYNFKPEDSQYSKIGISITQDGEKLKSKITNAYYKAGEFVDGDIPAIEWEEKKVLKQVKRMPTTASLEKRDAYLLGIVEQNEDRLKWEQNNATSGTSTTPVVKEEKPALQTTTNFNQEELNDLPF